MRLLKRVPLDEEEFIEQSEGYVKRENRRRRGERLLNVSKGALLREDRMPEALRCSELLLRMKPGDPLETRDRGFIYEQLDCPRQAADDFEYFIEQCPDDPVADVLKVQLAALDLSPKPLH